MHEREVFTDFEFPKNILQMRENLQFTRFTKSANKFDYFD